MSEDPSPQDHALVGTVLAGRYRVERLLGSGGMGSVYLAEHVLMKKAVAVKVLHAEMSGNGEIAARFEREAVAAARIDHPNVAAAMDFGRLPDGSFYLALEYVAGHSLRSLVEQGPLDPARALGIAHQVAEALVAAHAAGVVHRDLKPDNVMLVPQPDGREVVKVLDFGIAKVSGAPEAAEPARNLTRFGTVMGTAGYMAPEQALGLAVDLRADLYSCGIVLYEILAGHCPFTAEEPAQIVAKQLTEAVPPLPGVPPDVFELIQRLLAQKPDARIQTAAELSAELGRLRGSMGVFEAHPVSVVGVRSSPLGGPPAAPLATAATTFDASSAVAPPVHSKRRGALIAAGAVAAILALGAIYRSRGAAGPHEGSADVAPTSSATAAPVLEPSAPVPSALGLPAPSAELAPSASATDSTAPSAAPSTESETATGRPRPDRAHARRYERRQEDHHRRTGPGGIYIPPPSQWFR